MSAEASERQFRELVENLPELAWTAQPDGSIDYYNRRWYEYTGTSFEVVQGWKWVTLVDPDKLGTVMQQWRHSLDSGAPFEMEFPIRGADGEFRWFMTRVRPLHDSAGKIVRWFGSNTNIDERRRNDDFRETFLGILGHDLRNPLNTILMTAYLLEAHQGTPPEIRSVVERVTRSGIRMQRMIEQLLDLTRARLTTGIPIVLSLEEIDVAQLVGKIVDEVRAAHPQSMIELHTQRNCTARIDPDRVEQVISNLLGNAVTHGERGRPITISLTSELEAISVTIHNYGRPIDPGFLPFLFNPFARGERARGSSAGLGLGLYISERIVVAHHGSLSVQSDQETGTQFRMVLPRLPPTLRP